jgi:transposase
MRKRNVYSDKTRLAATREYLRGKLGIREVSQRHGVHPAALGYWARAYRVHGAAGVKAKRNKEYSPRFKMAVLQRMWAQSLSYRQTAALFNIRRIDNIGAWERKYEQGGIGALRGRYATLSGTVMTMKEEAHLEAEVDRRSRQELLEELQQLRMENAYLKKLQALAQGNPNPAHGKEPKPCKS